MAWCHLAATTVAKIGVVPPTTVATIAHSYTHTHTYTATHNHNANATHKL